MLSKYGVAGKLTSQYIIIMIPGDLQEGMICFVFPILKKRTLYIYGLTVDLLWIMIEKRFPKISKNILHLP